MITLHNLFGLCASKMKKMPHKPKATIPEHRNAGHVNLYCNAVLDLWHYHSAGVADK